MIYLSGVTNDTIEPALIRSGIGLMCNPGNSYRFRVDRYPVWAGDVVGMNNNIDPEDGLDYYAGLNPEKCLFLVSPDAYPDAYESFRRGLEFAPEVRALGFPVAVVAQDCAEQLPWESHFEEMDCVFLGGTRLAQGHLEWKESEGAERLVHRARNAGLWAHAGRCNSYRRFQKLARMGVLSVDGTFLKWRKRRRATDHTDDMRHKRGEAEIDGWTRIDQLPLTRWEAPAHPFHRTIAGANT